MGKDSSVSDWHKQGRKKELHKNKQARIAARDERVVAEKTVEQVKDEIFKLRKQHKIKVQHDADKERGDDASSAMNSSIPHHVKGKLDRLTKELKLVTQQREKDRAEAAATQSAPRRSAGAMAAAKAAFVPLDRPELSVYFDPVMNPYGAPPPGQPRKYYRRDGGTTMHLKEAGLPGDIPPPPPPPPPQTNRSSHTTYTGCGNENSIRSRQPTHHQRSSASLKRPHPQQQAQRHTTPTVKKPVLQTQTGSTGTTGSSTMTATKQQTTSLNPPDLPPPSASVLRSVRTMRATNQSKAENHLLLADIWASEQEMDHEERVLGNAALQGVGHGPDTKKPKGGARTSGGKASSAQIHTKEWFYRDTSRTIQGPYATAQMQQWKAAGFFPPDTPVAAASASNTCDPSPSAPQQQHFHPISSIMALQQQEERPSASARRSDSTNETLEQDAVQARIAALKGNIVPKQEDTVADRIAALKASNHNPHENGSGAPGEKDERSFDGARQTMDERPDDSVASRIAALRADRDARITENAEEPSNSETQSCSTDGGVEETAEQPQVDSVENRILALRALHRQQGNSIEDDSVRLHEQDACASNGPHDDVSAGPLPQAPPPPPPVPAYTMEHELPPYAVTEELAAYPIDGDDSYDVQYAVDEDYSVEGEDIAVGVYPVDGIEHEPQIKKAKIDAAVVAFLPSTLQHRAAKTRPDVSDQSALIFADRQANQDDDFHQFMKDVDES